jgi:hypothetical protein
MQNKFQAIPDRFLAVPDKFQGVHNKFQVILKKFQAVRKEFHFCFVDFTGILARILAWHLIYSIQPNLLQRPNFCLAPFFLHENPFA